MTLKHISVTFSFWKSLMPCPWKFLGTSSNVLSICPRIQEHCHCVRKFGEMEIQWQTWTGSM